MARRRNYKAMSDAKLFRCYWELRNGIRRADVDLMMEKVGDTTWDSAFDQVAYDVCIAKGHSPFDDFWFIEAEGKRRGIPLASNEQGWASLKELALKSKSVIELEPDSKEEVKLQSTEREVIEI
jgi:hypothetical protein